MRANGLMIGDWVLICPCSMNPYPDKVSGILTKTEREGKWEWITSQDFDDTTIEAIEPISLTAEILEKNGFEHKHDKEPIKRQYWIVNVGGGSIKVKVNRGLFLFNITGLPFREGYYNPSFNAHIQYVHELQHALRLCGLNELADNFKI